MAIIGEEHGHVLHIQLLIRTVDFGFAMPKRSSREEFLTSLDSIWYRDSLDVAESLLEDLRRRKEGQEPGFYVTGC